MNERLSSMPFAFWIQVLVLGVLVIEVLRKWNISWAKPALAVYGTVAVWYTGDYVLSRSVDYATFTSEVIRLSLFQTSGFLVSFRVLVSGFSRRWCSAPVRQALFFRRRGERWQLCEVSPRVLRTLLIWLIIGWVCIFSIGFSLSPERWVGLIWPPAYGTKVGMYPMRGLGSGASFIFNALGYIHVLICALFGVVAVLAKGPVRWIALVMILVAWPYFLFDRARNKMLALFLPGLAAYVLLGKQSLIARFSVVAVVCVGVTFWFGRVMDYRSNNGNLSSFFIESTSPSNQEKEGSEKWRQTTLGLDMLKELCWINALMESGRYKPNWGARYLAELANPIPRTIWPGKPTVGIDYSIARGFGGARTSHGVFATVATGMIGQGCVNFGPYLGVFAASGVFALWAAFLARLWSQRDSVLRLGLFLIGMGLTFNTGRDFTLLVLFPFLFGYLAVRGIEWIRGKGGAQPRPVAAFIPARRPRPPSES